MGATRDTVSWLFHLSGFFIIGADFFLPFGFLEKAIVFIIGFMLVYMIWIK